MQKRKLTKLITHEPSRKLKNFPPKYDTQSLIKALKQDPILPTSYYSFKIQKKLRALDLGRIIIAAILLRDDSDNFNNELRSTIMKFQKLARD